MGSEDKKDSQTQKILAKLKSMAEQKVERDKEQKDKRQQYEEERALEEEEKEKKILTSLLNTITLFDKLIIEINSRRSQYQKG
jgi:Skp family chaperone for outer membrane proteins